MKKFIVVINLLLLCGCFAAAVSRQEGSDTLRKYILTPAPASTPRINGAKVFGVRPGSEFLFTIAATGDRPMIFGAENLPGGLSLDPQSGRITGKN